MSSTKLLAAINKDAVAEVNEMLSSGISVNHVHAGRSLLLIALQCSSPRTVHVLIDKGADVQAKTPKGASALHIAASQTSRKLVCLLLSKGCDPNAKAADGTTPLCAARSADTVKELLSRGADPTTLCNKGLTPLHHLIEQKRVTAALALIESGASVNVKTPNQLTPLHYACQGRLIQVAERLLVLGADPYAPAANGKLPIDLVPDENSPLYALLWQYTPNAVAGAPQARAKAWGGGGSGSPSPQSSLPPLLPSPDCVITKPPAAAADPEVRSGGQQPREEQFSADSPYRRARLDNIIINRAHVLGDGPANTTVYGAELGATGQRIAAKVFRPSIDFQHRRVVESVTSDMTALCTLASGGCAHLVRSFGFVVNSASCEVVTALERATGGSLASEITRGPATDFKRVAQIMMQVVRGLQFLHEVGRHGVQDGELLHLKLTPDNILLFDEGTTAKIMDFGLEQIHFAASPQARRSASGLGAYQSPEQLPGSEMPIRASADVYAVGAIMWHWLRGEVPWRVVPGAEGVSATVRRAQSLIDVCGPAFPKVMPGSGAPAAASYTQVGLADIAAACLHPIPSARISISAIGRALEALVAQLCE